MEAGTQSNVPTRGSSSLFWLKASVLKTRRGIVNVASPVRKFPKLDNTLPWPLGESRTPLWSDASLSEVKLQRGKVQNLRIAARRLNRVLVPANEVFSFWKHLGRATRARGYVTGRQLREGCLYPEIGGGLCQLSNALFDAADKAGCAILERHPHSQIIPGSAAELGRDATVSWNYIDLRFQSEKRFQIVVELTQSELVVRFLGDEPVKKSPSGRINLSTYGRGTIDPSAHSCSTCGETNCFRHHRGQMATEKANATCAFILDNVSPEFQEYVREIKQPEDVLAIPLDGQSFNKPRYAWETDGFAQIVEARRATLWRSFTSRRLSAYGARRLQSQLESSEELAKSLSHALTEDVLAVRVAQNYLPFLWRDANLGGRSFQILAHRLPLRLLHERLDEAAKKWPERKTLAEFRAPESIAAWEWEAFQAADLIVTPNTKIAELLGSKAKLIPWHGSPPTEWKPGNAIVFPGPTAARKGAYEVRDAAKRLGLEVVLLGTELEGEDFWKEVKTRRVSQKDNWLDGAFALVQPSLVEERPRAILRAQASGLPVITTEHAGVSLSNRDSQVPFGDVEALEGAIQSLLA